MDMMERSRESYHRKRFRKDLYFTSGTGVLCGIKDNKGRGQSNQKEGEFPTDVVLMFLFSQKQKLN